MEIFEGELSKLNEKINIFDYPLSSVINPMLISCLTDVLNRQDWLQVFDYLVAHPFQPELLVGVALAVVRSVEGKLIKLGSV